MSHAQGSSDSIQSDIVAVTALERAWSNAVIHHDPARVAEIIDDDYMGTDGRGVTSDKADEIAEARAAVGGGTGPMVLAEDLSEIKVRVFGDTAILTCVNSAQFFDGAVRSTTRYRRTTVYVRRAGSWRCVSFHGSRMLDH